MTGPEAILWYAAFVLSTTAHEAAHALAAYIGGDLTAYRAGQVTLNPIPHIKREPFGMVIMPILAISQGWCAGWASTPYDPHWELRYPRRAAWMALAGPAANLTIALLAFGLLRLGLINGAFAPPDSVGFSQLVVGSTAAMDALGRCLSILLSLNVILWLLNLIPVAPFDGGTAVTVLLPDELALRVRAATRGRGFGIAVMVLFFLFFGQLIRPIFSIILRLVHPEYVWQ